MVLRGVYRAIGPSAKVEYYCGSFEWKTKDSIIYASHASLIEQFVSSYNEISANDKGVFLPAKKIPNKNFGNHFFGSWTASGCYRLRMKNSVVAGSINGDLINFLFFM